MIGRRIYKSVLSAVLIMILLIMSMFISIGEESDLVTIEVSSSSVEMGSSFTMTLTMDASINAEEIGVEGLDNFNVDSTSQSSSSQNINGVKSSTYQYRLTLSPKAIGEFTLKAVVNDGNQLYESKTLNMKVLERDQSLDGVSEDVFIKTVITSDEFYFGQSIVLSYELYSRYNLDDYGFLDEVKYDEFIVDGTDKENLESNIITIGENKYLKKEVKRDVLVATRTGSFEIPSYRFQANLSTGDFFSRSEPRYLDTEAISIRVKELPTNNRPDDFTGIVGSLDVQASLDKTEVQYGDAATLKVSISGSGNLDSIGALYQDKQNDFTIYETEKSTEAKIIDMTYVEFKEYEIIIVPEDVGNLTLDPVKLWYFDTEIGDYKSVEIPKQEINVTGFVEDPKVSIQSNSPTQKLLINQVNYLNDNDEFINLSISKKTIIYLFITIIFIIIGFVIYKRLQNKTLDHPNKRYIKAIKNTDSIEKLEIIFGEFIQEQTGLSIKSSHRRQIMDMFERAEDKELVERIVLDFENEKVNKKQDLGKLKEGMNTLITSVL